MIALWMLWAMAVSVPVALGTAVVAATLRRADRPERGAWIVGLFMIVAVPTVGLIRTFFGTQVGVPLSTSVRRGVSAECASVGLRWGWQASTSC